MPIYWTDSPNTEIKKMTLTKEDEERILSAARIHKQTIESNSFKWAEIGINKQFINNQVFTSIYIESGTIHSDGSREVKIVTYKYFIEDGAIRYSEIYHP